MNKKQNVPIFLDCKVGGVVPVTAEIRFIESNYISKNILKKTAEMVKNKEDSMYPHIDNKGKLISGLYFTVKNSNSCDIVIRKNNYFTVKKSKGDDIVIGHKDNYFTIIEEPNILILGAPWLWLFEVSLNLRHEYLTIYHYKDRIKIYGKYSNKKRSDSETKTPKTYAVRKKVSYICSSSESDASTSDNSETDSD